MKNILFLGGAHRGGKAITARVLQNPAVQKPECVVVADPKDYRATQLAEVWDSAGVRAVGLQEDCVSALSKVETDSALLSIDTIKPMSDILGNISVQTQWQLLARGLGTNGPMIGLSGTIPKGDNTVRAAGRKLIEALSTFIAPQSSSGIRKNLLNADNLEGMRKTVSAHSVERLASLDREPKDVEGGNLNLFWDREQFPLIVKEKPTTAKFREMKQQVLDVDLPNDLREYRSFAVASVSSLSVDFYVVESTRRGRSIRFFMPLMHALSTFSNSRGIGSTIAPATVTD